MVDCDGERARVSRPMRMLALSLPLIVPLAAFAQVSEQKVWTLSGSSWITDAPTRIADADGLFNADAGPPIRVRYANSGKESLEQLMAGDADFALMASVPLAMKIARLHAEGVSEQSWPVIVASIGISSHTHHVIADASRGIEKAADLAGHSLGLLFDSSAHYGWGMFADFHRIENDAVRLVDTPPDELATGLASGRFDAVVSWTPFSEQIQEQLGGRARSFPMGSLHSVGWLLVSRRALIERNPQLTERVLRGYAEAIAVLHNDPERTEELLGKSPDWLGEGRVAWKLALDWPMLAAMEASLTWSAKQLSVARPHLPPRSYIVRDPMERFRPRAVTLPIWLPEEHDSP